MVEVCVEELLINELKGDKLVKPEGLSKAQEHEWSIAVEQMALAKELALQDLIIRKFLYLTKK